MIYGGIRPPPVACKGLPLVISFGFILVVNAPQNMVAYGIETIGLRSCDARHGRQHNGAGVDFQEFSSRLFHCVLPASGRGSSMLTELLAHPKGGVDEGSPTHVLCSAVVRSWP